MPRFISFQNIKDIDLSALSNGIDDFPSRDNLSTTDELVSYYNLELQRLLNTLAPLKTRSVSFAHLPASWFKPALRQLRPSPGTPLWQNWPSSAQRNAS